MKVEVLASVMHQEDYSILNKMNVQSDAIIVNQCDQNKIEKFEYNGHNIQFLSLNERGVGLSRNNALMRATADIVLFADQDEIFNDGYEKIIVDEFKKNPKADMIIFNFKSLNPDRPAHDIRCRKRVRRYNCLKYGAVRFAVNLKAIKKMNLFYSLLFGGGSRYGSGEDSIFVYNFIKNGGKVYTSCQNIASVEQKDSTWFTGYNEKFFFDKGALISQIFPMLKYFLATMYFPYKFKCDISISDRRKLILTGIKMYNLYTNYDEWKNSKSIKNG